MFESERPKLEMLGQVLALVEAMSACCKSVGDLQVYVNSISLPTLGPPSYESMILGDIVDCMTRTSHAHPLTECSISSIHTAHVAQEVMRRIILRATPKS